MIDEVVKAIEQAGGEVFIVGGAVRDELAGRRVKDVDLEVHRLWPDQLRGVLSEFGQVEMVGETAGVFILRFGGMQYEFSIPRRDIPQPAGEKRGFQFEFDPFMGIRAALARRDYTINSMAYRWGQTEIIDPFGGGADLAGGRLRVTDPDQFVFDWLRAYRGIQFAARGDLRVTEDSINAIRAAWRAQFDWPWSLRKNRIREEWFKWADKGAKPSAGLRYLLDTGLIFKDYVLGPLVDCPQDPAWHPEGDVFTHTCHAVDQVAGESREVMFATLLHDIGKPFTTNEVGGRIVSPGHAEYGANLVDGWLVGIGVETPDFSAKVQTLVKNHMRHEMPSRGAKMRFWRVLRNVGLEPADWIKVVWADMSARPPLDPVLPPDVAAFGEFAVLERSAIDPLIQGRDLLALGWSEGPEIGQVLRKVEAQQLDGAIRTREEALAWVKANY